jgi:hypothetical protein
MTDIHFFGYDREQYKAAKKKIRELLEGAPYAGKLKFVWSDSESEGVVDRTPAPFIHIRGRALAFEEFGEDLIARLTPHFDSAWAFNQIWRRRQK